MTILDFLCVLFSEMSCLLSALEHTKVRLKPQCEKMIRDRKEMWEHAAKVKFKCLNNPF